MPRNSRTTSGSTPTSEEIGVISGFGWLGPLVFWLEVFVEFGLVGYVCVMIYASAALSTSCDDLKETLDAVRIRDLTPDMHDRVIILECAMANVNRGQGVGFKIGGVW